METAVAMWEQLLDKGVWSEDLVLDLSTCYRALGQHKDAITLLDEWLSTSEQVINAQHCEEAVLTTLLASEQPNHAIRALKMMELIKPKPIDRMRARINAGVFDEVFQGVTDHEFRPTIQTWMKMLRNAGYTAESIKMVDYAITKLDGPCELIIEKARLLSSQGLDDQAMDILADAHGVYGDDEPLIESIIDVCLQADETMLAAAWVQKLEDLQGKDSDKVRAYAAQIMLELGDLVEVNSLLADSGDTLQINKLRVSYFSKINDPSEAIYWQQQTVEQSGNALHELIGLARLYGETGKAEEAISIANHVWEQQPHHPGAAAILATHQGRDLERIKLLALQTAVGREIAPKRQRAWLSHALADYFHAVKNYDLAADLYASCNKISQELEPASYSREQNNAQRQKRLKNIRTFTNTVPPAALPQTKLPAFIVGVPRSGTTLTEQILNRHPQVTGMGECSHISKSLDWLKQDVSQTQNLTDRQFSTLHESYRNRFLEFFQPFEQAASGSSTHYFLDKMPDNYQHVDWILTLFPEAKIIYCKRDPREIALSCWRANFGAIKWAFTLEDIAYRIVDHLQIMDELLKKHERRIWVSTYSELVSAPEMRTREMLRFLGLNWDDNCLNPSAGNTVVRTASVHQVRQPIYNTSVKSWESYKKHLEPAMKIFNDHGILE